jgi:mannosyltransferase OCH1-like enzyme
MTIPRVIHQTIPDKANLDELISKNIQHLKSINKSWDYCLYDDKDCARFISDRYGSVMLNYYERINPLYGAARADLFRYLLIYEYGGVYLDIKSTIVSPLDNVLLEDDVYLLSKWRNGPGEDYEGWGIYNPSIDGVESEYQQWYIAASPGHPFLKAVIEKVRHNIDRYSPFTDGVGKNGVMKLTGPIAYTSAIEPIRSSDKCRVVDIENLGFRYSIIPSENHNQYGHVKLFKNHYTTLTAPIVTRRQYSRIEGLLIKNLHQYGSAYRRLRSRINKGRRFGAKPA